MTKTSKCDRCMYKGKCEDEELVRREGMGVCLRFSTGVEVGDLQACTDNKAMIEHTNVKYTNFVLIGITPFGVITHASCSKLQLVMALDSLQKTFEKVLTNCEPMEALELITLLAKAAIAPKSDTLTDLLNNN